MNTSLPAAVEVETGPNPKGAVIWLHGLGADGHDFEPAVPALVPSGALSSMFAPNFISVFAVSIRLFSTAKRSAVYPALDFALTSAPNSTSNAASTAGETSPRSHPMPSC